MIEETLSDKIIIEHLIEDDTPKEMKQYYKAEDVRETVKKLKELKGDGA